MKLSVFSRFFFAGAVIVESTSARLSTIPRRLRAEQAASLDDGANPPSDLSMPTNTDQHASDGAVVSGKEVCVVGGGPSGVYAAHLLEEMGYSVALFDEASRLGGKTVPFGEDNSLIRHSLTSDMILVNKLIGDFGLEGNGERRENQNFLKDDDVFPYKRESWFENLLLSSPGNSKEAWMAGMKYVEIWNEYEDVITQPNHDNIPAEFMVPADQWLADNDVTAMTEFSLFYNGLSNYGYGFLDKIPAIYILKYCTPPKFTDGTDLFFPMHLIFERLGSYLDDVHRNTRVERVEQLPDETWKVYAKNNMNDEEAFMYKCDDVILAFPPTTNALSIVDGLDPATKDLFTNVHAVSYWEVIVSDLPDCAPYNYLSCLAADNAYFKSPDKADALAASHDIPNVYFVPSEGGNVLVMFNGGSKDFDQEDVFDIIRGHLHAAFDYEPGSYSIELYKKWPYFPHVSSEKMKDGFYSKLEEVQGEQNLYITGGFRDFELVENSMRTTEDLLLRHFSSKN